MMHVDSKIGNSINIFYWKFGVAYNDACYYSIPIPRRYIKEVYLSIVIIVDVRRT